MKPIPNYPNYAITEDGEVWSLRFNKKLTPCRNSRGYMQVVLCKDLKYKNYTIHRLVAEAYVDNVNNYKMVNHINGIKTDNRIENLEWVTASQNIQHAFDTGLKKPSVTRLVLDTATGIFYDSITEAAKYYNVNMKTLHGYLTNAYPNKTSLIYA
jgi:hypothetical protein